jgi:rod shape-determining protein MreC
MTRFTSGTWRVVLILSALLVSAYFLLPAQSRVLLQAIGKPVALLVALPLNGFAALDHGVGGLWDGYVALRSVHEENERLRREIEFLRAQNGELREAAEAGRRLAGLLTFKERIPYATLAAQVIGRDASAYYRSLILNKGERDGVQAEMGVVTPAGVVGRVVKVGPSTAVVLLVTDPHNAVTGLIQRTRDEGLVEGTPEGRARLKYIPLLSTAREGDAVVTSGLTGGFPRGIPIGAITRVDKVGGELFQSAEILPDVDSSRLEEVLIITNPRPLVDAEPLAVPKAGVKGKERAR